MQASESPSETCLSLSLRSNPPIAATSRTRPLHLRPRRLAPAVGAGPVPQVVHRAREPPPLDNDRLASRTVRVLTVRVRHIAQVHVLEPRLDAYLTRLPERSRRGTDASERVPERDVSVPFPAKQPANTGKESHTPPTSQAPPPCARSWRRPRPAGGSPCQRSPAAR